MEDLWCLDNNSIETFNNQAGALCFNYSPAKVQIDLDPENEKETSLLDLKADFVDFESDISKTLSISDAYFEDRLGKNLY